MAISSAGTGAAPAPLWLPVVVKWSLLRALFMACCLAVIPVIGKVSDRVGRKAVVRSGAISLIVLSFPSLWLVRGHSDIVVFLGLLIMGLSLICFSATMPSTLPSLFPTMVRAGALAIAFNLSISLFGGTTSVVMTSLINATGFLMWPAVYLMAAGVIGLVAIHFVPESNRRPLWGSTPSAASREEAEDLAEELNSRAGPT